MSTEAERARMVEQQLVRRGISDARVLEAFRRVPREAFVPDRFIEVAYEDGPQPIGEGQTISQPYVVALTLEALQLQGRERVLEIGAGSGYAAALLGELAEEVYTVERLPALADAAMGRLAALARENVHVVLGDGSLGLPEHGPYDAIAVAAAGPAVPKALREQLAIGGRLVIPIGQNGGQSLVRVTRTSEDGWNEEPLIDVTFVPLIGAQAWPEARRRADGDGASHAELVDLVRLHAEPLASPSRLLARAEEARVVVLGVAIEGSAELQHARARLTRELLRRGGFSFLAVAADWTDGARIDEHVRGKPPRRDLPIHAFARFPSFPWHDPEIRAFVEELRARGDVGFHGLDLFGTHAAIAIALERLAEQDPEAAQAARERCASASPWRRLVADLDFDAREVVKTLTKTLGARVLTIGSEGARSAEAAKRVLEDGETYYEHLLRGSLEASSIQADAMSLMLKGLLADYGPKSRCVVWASAAQTADASGIDSGIRGQRTLGQLTRAHLGPHTLLVGMSADQGTILASPAWGTPPRATRLGPAAAGSYERAIGDAGTSALAITFEGELKSAFDLARTARAIGPVYRAETQLVTNYVPVSLSLAYDAMVFVERTSAVHADDVGVTCDPEEPNPLEVP